MTAEDFADLILARRRGPGQWMANCQAHEDRSQSLPISNGSDGAVQVRCAVGCSVHDIVHACELDWTEFCSRPPRTPDLALARASKSSANDRLHTQRPANVCGSLNGSLTSSEAELEEMPLCGKQLATQQYLD